PDVFAAPAITALGPAGIMASVGDVPYVWSIESDALVWGEAAATMLSGGGMASIATGRAYARWLTADSPGSRFDAVMNSQGRDEGSGVPYQAQYALKPPRATAVLWIEDVGRWFAGPDGRPARAQGVVRIINER